MLNELVQFSVLLSFKFSLETVPIQSHEKKNTQNRPKPIIWVISSSENVAALDAKENYQDRDFAKRHHYTFHHCK